MSNESHDAQTLSFYEREAEAYAARDSGKRQHHLLDLLARLAPGASVLELGCGAGHDAHYMLGQGFDVTATDGSPRLAAIAAARLHRPVPVIRFEELDADARYDAVWANASLHHAPLAALPEILARIHRALKLGGLFAAGYKSGAGPGRDGLGRYYSFPTAPMLTSAYASAGPWSECEISEGVGRGYDDIERPWLHVTARKAAP